MSKMDAAVKIPSRTTPKIIFGCSMLGFLFVIFFFLLPMVVFIWPDFLDLIFPLRLIPTELFLLIGACLLGISGLISGYVATSKYNNSDKLLKHAIALGWLDVIVAIVVFVGLFIWFLYFPIVNL